MSLANTFTFQKKESCPCGSGKTYGECCCIKKPREFHGEKEKMAILSKCAKKSRVNLCLCKDCNARAIGAHAIQENGVLSKLAVDNKVMIQNKKKEGALLEIDGKKEPFTFLEPLEISKATVQTCFCKPHDDKLFADIEKADKEISPTNLKQLFLFAYRTFSFEYYTQITVMNLFKLMFRESPQLTKDFRIVPAYRDNSKKMKEMNYYRDLFNDGLAKDDYSELATLVIQLPYEIQFANYACIAPSFDLLGKKVNVFDKKNHSMRRIFITSFSKDKVSYILVSTFKKDLPIYGDYLRSFEKVSQQAVKCYFNSIIPIISENLIISPMLWAEWDKVAQGAIQYAVSESQPRYIDRLLRCLKFTMKNLSQGNSSVKYEPSEHGYNLFGKYNLDAEMKFIKTGFY